MFQQRHAKVRCRRLSGQNRRSLPPKFQWQRLLQHYFINTKVLLMWPAPRVFASTVRKDACRDEVLACRARHTFTASWMCMNDFEFIAHLMPHVDSYGRTKGHLASSREGHASFQRCLRASGYAHTFWTIRKPTRTHTILTVRDYGDRCRWHRQSEHGCPQLL